MEQIFFYITSLAYFLVATFLSFYIPGRVILGKIKEFSFFTTLIVSIVLGFVLWGWQGYIFGYLNLRFLSYVYLVIFLVGFVIQKYYLELKNIKISYDWKIIFLVLIGTIGQTIAYWSTGWKTSQGMIVSAYNALDHIWHIALTNELTQRIPPNEPAQAGIVLHNYHYWFNLVTAELIRVFHLPLFQTQFIGMYVGGALLLGASVYLASKQIYNNRLFIAFCLFFIYFAADATFWFTLFTKKHFDFNVGSIVDLGFIYFDSPPRGYAMIISFISLFLLIIFTKQKSWRLAGIIGLLIGTTIGFKVYSGIGMLAGLFFYVLYYLYKKEYIYIGIGLIALTCAAVVFLPVNYGSGGLIFLPFEVPRDFFTQAKLGLADWPARWEIYKQHSNYIRIVQYGVMMGILYLFLQYGFRVIGFYPLKKTREIVGLPLLIFLYGVGISSIILALFFYQKEGGQNIDWFLLVASNMILIIASLNITFIKERFKNIGAILIVLIVVLILPRWIYSLASSVHGQYFSSFQGISNQEYSAYQFLKDKTDPNGLVLVISDRATYDIASLIPIIAKRYTYYSGVGSIGQRDSQQIQKRTQLVATLKEYQQPEAVHRILAETGVKYILLESGQEKALLNFEHIGLPIIFKNNFATIMEVTKKN